MIVWIAVSNPAEGMDVRLVFVMCCVRSGLCNGLTPRSGSYQVCVCVCVSLNVCDLKTSTIRQSTPNCVVVPQNKSADLGKQLETEE